MRFSYGKRIKEPFVLEVPEEALPFGQVRQMFKY